MSEINKVVAHHTNGKLVKGTTQDFFPNRPVFHVAPAEGGSPVEVRCKDLKAVFFVRDLAGDARRKDPRGFLTAPSETRQGKKIAVLFRDGELLCGYTLTFSPDRDGFFLFPADAQGNNLRIHVMSAACVEIKAGPAADALVQKVLNRRAA
jgi:hypothetical protein